MRIKFRSPFLFRYGMVWVSRKDLRRFRERRSKVPLTPEERVAEEAEFDKDLAAFKMAIRDREY